MYKLTATDIVIGPPGNVYIPADPANTDYQQYLAWLASPCGKCEGRGAIPDFASRGVIQCPSCKGMQRNTPEPYVPPPPPIPQSVTRFQALATLAAAGHLPTIRAYIATLDQDDITRLAWESASEWERTSPTLAALATMLGLSDTDVDHLFMAASQVSA